VSRVRVALATKNPGKVREIAAIVESAPIELTGPDAEWVPPHEDADTYRENALIKARSLVALMGVPCLADDSGIEVDALDGGPGPRSARFAGDGAGDEENLRKLIEVVRRTPERGRGAR
jgi:XTP/dITP diphosphohydrolase